MKKIILALCMILLSSTVFNFGSTNAKAAEGSKISLSSQSSNVYVGDTLKLQVAGEGFDDLFGVEAVISFDATSLQVLSVKADDAYDTFNAVKIDNKEGKLYLPLVRKQLQPNSQQSVQLAEITFKPLQAKTAMVNLQSVKAVSSETIINQQGYKDLKVLIVGFGEAITLNIKSKPISPEGETGSGNETPESKEIAEGLHSISEEVDPIRAAEMLQALIKGLTSEPTTADREVLLHAAVAVANKLSLLPMSNNGVTEDDVFIIAANDISIRERLLKGITDALSKWNMNTSGITQLQFQAIMTYALDGRDTNKLGVYRFNETSEIWEFVRDVVHQVKDEAFIVSVGQPGTYRIMVYSKIFEDINDLYSEAKYAIEVLTAQHILNGTSETTFSPYSQVTRAEFTSMIVRALGMDRLGSGSNTTAAFPDVASDAWYYDNIEILSQHNIINGFSDGTFRPNDAVTREQMVVIALNALNKSNLTLTENGASDGKFADDESISVWAQDAINKARESGLVSGTGQNLFFPKESLNRADAAVFIWKMIQKLN